MQKIIVLFIIAASLLSCQEKGSTANPVAIDTVKEKSAIADMLDSFNVAAAKADYNRYFSFYANGATFIGTDATEHWDKEAFMKWSKQFFDRGKAWNFTAIDRHIYFGNHPDIAWFDELLNTQMKICRGSGVVVKEDSVWKVKQYVLSMTFPNEKIDDVLPLKAPIEDSLIKVMSKK